jgi:peptide/nickel transport system substrate-binding protein
VAVFSPGTPFDSKAGIEIMMGKHDLERVKREIVAAGYNGETVVLLGPADTQGSYAQALVATDLLRRLGITVDMQSIDRATMVLRRASKQPPDKGGWNIFIGSLSGTNNFNPASQLGIRGNGKAAWFGWPTMPRIEALRQDWFDAPDLVAQQRICTEIEKQFWIDAPYIPLGCEYYQTAYSAALTQPRIGFLQAYDVMRHS